jgi:hypothetical protein
MKTWTLAVVWLALSAAPALAITCSACGLHPAPAPLLGAGIPSAVAIGGTLLGSKFWRRKKK